MEYKDNTFFLYFTYTYLYEKSIIKEPPNPDTVNCQPQKTHEEYRQCLLPVFLL